MVEQARSFCSYPCFPDAIGRNGTRTGETLDGWPSRLAVSIESSYWGITLGSYLILRAEVRCVSFKTSRAFFASFSLSIFLKSFLSLVLSRICRYALCRLARFARSI